MLFVCLLLCYKNFNVDKFWEIREFYAPLIQNHVKRNGDQILGTFRFPF